MADLELIATAIEVLSTCSDGNFSLEIGDAGVFKELMQELHATPEQAENIRYLIETKNYPALNDLLDAMGNDKAASIFIWWGRGLRKSFKIVLQC